MTKLPKIVNRRQKRLGRGYGSGKGGHTSGRGQKGQKSRGGLGVLFEGFKMKKSLLRRLPIQRGKTKFKPGKKPLIVNVEVLNLLANGTKVNIETLAKAGIVNPSQAKEFGVKILGNGKLEKSLILELPSSKSVQAQFAKLDKKSKKE